MSEITLMVGRAGAGVSQVRSPNGIQTTRLMDQERSSDDVKAATLQLIRSALAVSTTSGHDLDVLA